MRILLSFFVLFDLIVAANLQAMLTDATNTSPHHSPKKGSPIKSPSGSPIKEKTASQARLRRGPLIADEGDASVSEQFSLFPKLREPKSSAEAFPLNETTAHKAESADQGLWVFYVTAPHDQPNRGDTDYVVSVLRAFDSKSGLPINAHYINENCQLADGQKIYDVSALYQSNNKIKCPEYQIVNSPIRINAVKNLVEYIKFLNKRNTVLHLQLRAPETGCMFTESDLETLKKHVDKLVITCHEWSHLKKPEDRQKQLEFFEKADHVIFLNDEDKQQAVHEAQYIIANTDLAVLSSVSNIGATLPTKIKTKYAEVAPNILVFGLMRAQKSFLEAVMLAEKISELDPAHCMSHARVIIAGKPHDQKLLEKMVIAKFGKEKTLEIQSYVNAYVQREIEKVKKELLISALKESNPLSEEVFQEEASKIRNSPKLSRLKEKYSKFYPTVSAYKFSAQASEKAKIDGLLAWMGENRHLPEALPIDFHFNINSADLDALSYDCKFCLKYEDKPFANNSSSIINALHRKLIVFSKGSDDLTSKDFGPNGKYAKALFLFNETDTENCITQALGVMEEIQAEDGLYQETVSALNTCVQELYSDDKIARDHVEVYKNLLPDAFVTKNSRGQTRSTNQ